MPESRTLRYPRYLGLSESRRKQTPPGRLSERHRGLSESERARAFLLLSEVGRCARFATQRSRPTSRTFGSRRKLAGRLSEATGKSAAPLLAFGKHQKAPRPRPKVTESSGKRFAKTESRCRSDRRRALASCFLKLGGNFRKAGARGAFLRLSESRRYLGYRTFQHRRFLSAASERGAAALSKARIHFRKVAACLLSAIFGNSAGPAKSHVGAIRSSDLQGPSRALYH